MKKKIVNCVCGSAAKLEFGTINLFNGKIVLKQQPHYKCQKCKKEFVTSEQMRKTEKQLHNFFSKQALV